MRIRFWGTRGSIARLGPETIRYGGNTSCVELRTRAGTLIVLDCGTGARGLGEALLAEPSPPRRGTILISHTHWDHIQGLPFFSPLFASDQSWEIYGPRGFDTSLSETLAGQMQYTYFPITMEQFEANVSYHDLVAGSFRLGDVQVTTTYLNHPALTLGYALEADGVRVVYLTDHEPQSLELAQGERAPRGAEEEAHAHLIENADLLIHDTQFTAREYVDRVGWGHSPVEFAVEAARAGGVRRLALFHHDPGRDDDAIAAIEHRAREQSRGSGLEVFAAAEGMVLDIQAPDRPRRESPDASAVSTQVHDATGQTVLLAVQNPEIARAFAKVIEDDGLRLIQASDGDSLLALARQHAPSLVILQRFVGGRDALECCKALCEGSSGLTVAVVVEREQDVELSRGARAGVTDWLTWPFRPTYARTYVRRWLLGGACRWRPAQKPGDEAERLRALQDLGVLDTQPEERFDRYTRIAAALFDVPIALVSLIDANRQWFKSHHGLDAEETPREMAFCAHTILGKDVLQVPDALQDPRFADNPLVTGPPRLRFYAGFPLVVGDGRCVGTLCLIDQRPRALDEVQLELLADLAHLVEAELGAGRAA